MTPQISIIMGSKSDWATMKKTADILDQFGVAYEKKVVSAHRTPDLMFKHAQEARGRGIKIIIAGAGGAAHLPGMVAAKTSLPVIGVPVKSRALSGVDSLYSIVQMPGGVPVATMAIGFLELILSIQSFKCQAACRWQPWLLGRQELPMLRSLLFESCPLKTVRLRMR